MNSAELKGLICLMIVGVTISFSSWLSNFEAAALPGSRITAGMTYSAALSISCLLSGFILQKLKDYTAFKLFSVLSLLGMTSLFLVCGGNSNSTLGLMSFFA
jgi:hypothetical protein